nr:retrovirus-related Pol polyprotein from transposon TNT 1-94 [Tanacetum cinerariifolium]
MKMGSIRVVLGLAASLDLEVEQMDVKTTFLLGDLDKEIYMEQPEGFQVKGRKTTCVDFKRACIDHCVFFQRFGDDDFIILLLYVDDMLIVGKNIGRITQLKRDLSKSFAMKDLWPAKQIIGIQIFRDRSAKKLHISQEQYIEKVLRRFNIDKAKVVSSILTPNFKLTDKDCPSSKKNIEKMDRVPYASAVGSLMYAMVCTRPDLAHAVEAEYVAATEACKELLWLKRFLQELGFKQQRYAVLVTIKVLFTLLRNRCFTKEQNILMSGIIGLEMPLKMVHTGLDGIGKSLGRVGNFETGKSDRSGKWGSSGLGISCKEGSSGLGSSGKAGSSGFGISGKLGISGLGRS